MASSGKKVRLVELGPGRGTLMDDILRASYSNTFSTPFQSRSMLEMIGMNETHVEAQPKTSD